MKKRVLVLISAVLVPLILLGMAIGVTSVFIARNIDYAADEMLFEVAKKSNTVSYLAYDGDGSIVEICKESSGPAKTWVPIEEVSPWLKAGFIAAEDRNFYKHRGINLKRTVAAAINSVLHYTARFGASTITQQVIKNISGDSERSVRRKANELFRAIHLERKYSKDEILEAYINVIPMAGNIYGVREASLRYFGKQPSELSLAEAATLVGITNAPTKYDPLNQPQACLEKRNRVLYAMLDNGDISEYEYSNAIAQELMVCDSSKGEGGIVSWFVETAREDVLKDLSAKYGVSRVGALMLLNSGTQVILTLDPTVQNTLEEFFEDEINLPPAATDGLKYSMVICDSHTGDIVGVIGSAGKKDGNRLYNYALAPHPPASTLKPLALYAPLIDSGMINWATVFDDTPLETSEVDGEIRMYPQNSPDVYEGNISVYEALLKSKNTVAARMYKLLSPEQIFNILRNDLRLGGLVEKRLDSEGRILSDLALAPLALGQLTDGVSLLDLTHAYTAFPSDGLLRASRTYYGVFDEYGNVMMENSSTCKRIFNESTARVMNMMLAGVCEEGTARSVTLKECVDTAAKTGTSSGNRDKLLVGYTPYFTAGIWCGYSDGRTGIYSQSPNHIELWDAVMKRLHERCVSTNGGDEQFNLNGIKMLQYCSLSGCLAGEECVRNGCANFGFFTPQSEPYELCEIH